MLEVKNLKVVFDKNTINEKTALEVIKKLILNLIF